ncbi:uncharacterized protein LOC131331017 [Rhododendron vialii]|uniref:uncharacterized protein LOC131331017 n=1 Tax=Rhododendron vialii TaxID=182163 RepID=UPI00265E7A91|nr:uncharacterized protein LOC131331017 [Rhododendron vialii]
MNTNLCTLGLKKLKVFEQMGSLMAGWDSPVQDPKTVKIQRNKSATKEEIEAYWRSKKKDEEEHLRAIPDMLTKSSEESKLKEPERKLQRSSSVPLSNTKDGLLDMGTETSFEKLIKKNGWWTRCTSAFLNEPPVIASDGGPAHKYLSQFHVAGIATPKSHTGTGISTT